MLQFYLTYMSFDQKGEKFRFLGNLYLYFIDKVNFNVHIQVKILR